MSRFLKIGFLVIVAGALIGGGVYVFANMYDQHDDSHRHNASSQSDSSSDSDNVKVRVTPIDSKGMERQVTRPASVHSFDFADLYARASGFLHNQDVDIGQKVNKGDVLAEILAPELNAAVAEAKANLEKVEADVHVKESKVTAKNADLEEAKAQVEQSKSLVEHAQAMLELRQKEYRRVNALVSQNAIQRELVDEKVANMHAASAELSSKRQGVLASKSHVASATAAIEHAKAELVDAKAQVDVAKAALQKAQVFLEYTKIASPYTGIITKRSFHEGDFIRDAAAGGETPLFRVARIDKMRVITHIPHRYVPYLKEGNEALLVVDGVPNGQFKGKVSRLAGAEDYSSRTMRVEVDIDNKDFRLSDGMYGDITIYFGRAKGMVVPSKALVTEESATDHKQITHVIVVRNGKAKFVPVRVVDDNGIQASVYSDDLRADDLVVEEHSAGLKDGDPVDVARQEQAVSTHKSPTH